MNDRVDRVGIDIWHFLKRALLKRDPERDVAESKDLVRELVDALSTTDLDDRRWEEGRTAAVAPSARGLRDKPELWNEAVKLTAVYFSRDWRPEHPRLSRNMARGGTYPVSIDLADRLLALLLNTPDNSEQRKTFFASVDDWGVLQSLERLLPDSVLDKDDIRLLLLSLGRFAKGDPLGPLLDALFSWARRNPPEAKSLVTDWLTGAPEYALPVGAIQCFIEGSVAGSGDLGWRDLVIQRLDSRATEESWALAAFVACFAWPDEIRPNVSLRHAALVDRVRRFPELLVVTGLRALTRDAFSFPLASYEASLVIFDLLPPTVARDKREHAVAGLVDVCLRAVAGAKKQNAPDLRPFLSVFDKISEAPLGRQMFALDGIVNDLVDVGPDSVNRFLSKWLARHAGTLIGGLQSLDELFPLASQGHEELFNQWLLEWLVSADIALRNVALGFFGREHADSYLRPIPSMSEARVRALVAVIGAGEPLLGSAWVPAVTEIALLRPEIVGFVTELLSEDAVEQYPALLLRCLDRWSQEDPWRASRTTIVERIEARRAEWLSKSNVAEVFWFPTLSLWYEWQGREMNSAYRRADSRSPFLNMITKVPIARGEASTPTGYPADAVQFGRYESSSEVSIIELLDPVEARLRQLRRTQEVERLVLEAQGGGSGARSP